MTPQGSVQAGLEERADLVEAFFGGEAPRLAELCHVMARRFIRGGRLLAFGVGAAATDAQHISVEFVHPVIVGKKALPALALSNDAPSALGLAVADSTRFIGRQLSLLGRPEDMAIGITHSSNDAGAKAVAAALAAAREIGMLTVSLEGPSTDLGKTDHAFRVQSADPFIVQEIHETLYHVLWESIHIFFDHKGLLDEPQGDEGRGTGRSSFLYPFLSDAEKDLSGVLAEVEASILNKGADVIAMRGVSARADELVETARLIVERIRSGGKVLAFGNGGSATDAQDFVTDLIAPPSPLVPVPALSLTNDSAVVSAVGNDVGFENIFARQVIAYGAGTDVAVAISTSGGSRNVIAAVEEAKKRGLLTVGLSGYGGGRLSEICERSHAVDGDYVPRIQETQATLYHTIRRLLG